jgi:hypothetical protein
MKTGESVKFSSQDIPKKRTSILLSDPVAQLVLALSLFAHFTCGLSH